MQIDPEAVPGYVVNVSPFDSDTPHQAAAFIATALSKAKRPVLLLGNGVTKGDRKQVHDLINKLGIPVITSILGRDILPYDHPLNFGFLGAGYGHRYANMIIHKKQISSYLWARVSVNGRPV